MNFEQETDIVPYIENSFEKITIHKKRFYHISKDGKIIIASKKAFQYVMETRFGVHIPREPDEAFILIRDHDVLLYIIEKKFQQVNGTAEQKIFGGYLFREQYEMRCEDNPTGIKFKVKYVYVLSDYYKEKFQGNDENYKDLKRMFYKYDIPVFYGNDRTYFQQLSWYAGIPLSL